MLGFIVFSTILSVSLAAPSFSDDACVNFDQQAATLFGNLQTVLKQTASESINVTDVTEGMFGFGISWKNGKAGNFSSLGLGEKWSNGTSSVKCSESSTQTLVMNVGFKDLAASFDTFAIITPFLTIGGGKAVLSLEGENLLVSVTTTTTTDPKTKTSTCASAALNEFKFTNWGSLNLDLEGGMINWVINWIFNKFISTRIVSLLTLFDVGDKINTYAVQYLSPVFQSQGKTICQLINMA